MRMLWTSSNWPFVVGFRVLGLRMLDTGFNRGLGVKGLGAVRVVEWF